MRTIQPLRIFVMTVLLLISGRVANAASVTLAWDPDTSGTVTGYILYWGTTSGQYTQSQTLGNVTSVTVTPAANESMVYFAARSYNSVGMSALSQEVVAWVGTVWRTPTLMRPGDFDGDGKADAMVYRGSTGQWFANNSSNGTTATALWGAPSLGDVPIPADFDGDGKTDFAVYRNTTGGWFLNQTQAGATSLTWGAPAYGDLPVPEDYDGDGKADVGVFRRKTGEWLVRRSTDGTLLRAAWGAAATTTSRCLATTTATGRPTSRCIAAPLDSGSFGSTTSPRPPGAGGARFTATFRCRPITTGTASSTSRSSGRPTGRGS